MGTTGTARVAPISQAKRCFSKSLSKRMSKRSSNNVSTCLPACLVVCIASSFAVTTLSANQTLSDARYLQAQPLTGMTFDNSAIGSSFYDQQRAGFSGDSDNDGIPDVIDVDDDNDTIPDDAEGTVDTDGDGIADCLDLDSDNDGLPDLYEVTAGTGLQSLVDADGNGALDQGVSVGENGLADVAEQGDESSVSITASVDLDGDGIRDQQDLDSDNDGIPDVVEAGSSDTDFDGKYDFFLDLNGDGLGDRLTASPIIPRDTDQDGITDNRDLDSDGDGLSDRLETSGADTDGDGRVDGFIDVNVDGLHDPYTTELTNVPDTDRDGFPDYRDTDSDGDGVSDAEEGFSGTVDSEPVVPSQPFDPATVEPEPAVTLETGENGSVLGCSLSAAALAPKQADPVFLLMLLAALLITGRSFLFKSALMFRSALNSALNGVRHHLKATVATLAALTLLSGCAAQSTVGRSVNLSALQPYAGLGLGASFLNANTTGTDLEQDQDFSAAGQVTLGVDMGRRLALELRAADLGEATFETGEALGYQVADASALAKFQFNKLAAFGRVGVGALFNDGDFDTVQKNKTHLLIGAGVDYALSRQLSVRSEWQGHDVDVMHGQLSLIFRFGAPRQNAPVLIASSQQGNSAPQQQDGQTSAAQADTAQAAEQFQPVPTKPRLPVQARNPEPTVQQPEPATNRAAEELAVETEADNEALSALDIQKIPESTVAQTPPAPQPQPEVSEAPQQQTDVAAADTQIASTQVPTPANPPAPTRSEGLKPLITVPAPPAEKKIAASRPDSDDDGIDDASDNCPGSRAGEPVLANGCSMFGDSVPGLTFFPDTDRLTSSAEQVLDTVAQAMLDDAQVGITVAAHTRASTDANAAMFLTRRRTIAIIRYLSEQGIDATRLRPEAYGDTQPLASAVEPSDNDRVVLSVR